MRIVVHGQQAFGKSVLEALLNRGDDVVGVYCAPDQGTRSDPLKEYALEKGFEVNQPASWNDPAVWEKLKSHNADLCVMAYVTRFVPEEALNIPTHGSIQYHPSLLPSHKGPSSINWPIILGEEKTGLSIFWPDNGLDTGPILLQKEVKIGPEDTLGSLYFNSLYPMGVDAMLEAVDLVKAGKAPKLAQDPDAGSYEGWCRAEDAQIDWSKSTAEVFNLIRGCDPQPGAWTELDGKKLQVFDCKPATAVSGKPGEIVAIDDNSLTIATADGGITVQRVRPDGGDKQTASEFVRTANLVKGKKISG
jgi:methionyl-tRNA formyltransferase